MVYRFIWCFENQNFDINEDSFKISEKLTFLFVIVYIFRDCLADLFQIAKIDFSDMELPNDEESVLEELKIYEVFKQLVWKVNIPSFDNLDAHIRH